MLQIPLQDASIKKDLTIQTLNNAEQLIEFETLLQNYSNTSDLAQFIKDLTKKINTQSDEEMEKIFTNTDFLENMYQIFSQLIPQKDEGFLAFLNYLVRSCYRQKKSSLKFFCHSLIPLLISTYIISRYPSKENLSDESSESSSLIEEQQQNNQKIIGYMEMIFLEIYNQEITSLNMKVDQLNINEQIIQQLIKLNRKDYEQVLNNQPSQTSAHKTQGNIVIENDQYKYEKIEAITQEGMEDILEVILQLYVDRISNLNLSQLEDFLKMTHILLGAKLTLSQIKDQIKDTNLSHSLLLVRLSPVQMQKLVYGIYSIYTTHKSLREKTMNLLGLILKKSSNECQFRIAGLCQSVIELTKDDFEDAFF